MFEINLNDLQTYEKFLRRSPKQIAAVRGMVLNNYAFGTRDESIKVIEKRMIIKQSRFVPRRIQVKKSRLSGHPRNQISKTGSTRLPRFSAWEEQELGKKTERSRVFTLFARGGSKGRVARPQARLKPGRDRPTPEDYKGKNRTHRAIVMLQILGREGYKKPFIIRYHKKVAPGLYKFTGGKKKRKLRILQAFEPREVQPKRISWLIGGRDRYFRKNPPGKTWSKAMKRVLKFKRK